MSEDTQAFNWFAVLKDLCDGMPIDLEQHKKLCKRSASWVTCGCSQFCQGLPLDYCGAPVDKTLRDLGVVFHVRISLRDWTQALKQLHEIEKRAHFLLDTPQP